MSLSTWLGNLIGTMIDPLTWGAVLGVAFLFRSFEWYKRAAIAVACVVAISLAVIVSSRMGDPSNARLLLLTAVGTLIWSVVASGIIRKTSAAPASVEALSTTSSPGTLQAGLPLADAVTQARSKPALPDVLHFKSNNDAFEYACDFMTGEVREKEALTAIIVDGEAEQDSVQGLIEHFESKSDENIFDVYRVMVSGQGDGFPAPALCYKKGMNLQHGDLVFWVPMQIDPMLSAMEKDKRSTWIGGIVAILEPSFSMKNGWVVKEKIV